MSEKIDTHTTDSGDNVSWVNVIWFVAGIFTAFAIGQDSKYFTSNAVWRASKEHPYCEWSLSRAYKYLVYERCFYPVRVKGEHS